MIKVDADYGDGLSWGKSSRSGDNGGDCVGVTMNQDHHVHVNEAGQIGIRDTKLGPDGPVIWVSAEDFLALRSFD